MLFDNWITENSLEVLSFCARRCGGQAEFSNKKKKAESARLKVFDINFGEFRKAFNLWTSEGISVPLDCPISAFFILHRIFYFSLSEFTRPLTQAVLTSSIGRQRLRQAVCKTVARLKLWKFKSFPMRQVWFQILWAKLKRLSVGLPNRMLRVRFPSLTPEIFDFFNGLWPLIFELWLLPDFKYQSSKVKGQKSKIHTGA